MWFVEVEDLTWRVGFWGILFDDHLELLASHHFPAWDLALEESTHLAVRATPSQALPGHAGVEDLRVSPTIQAWKTGFGRYSRLQPKRKENT